MAYCVLQIGVNKKKYTKISIKNICKSALGTKISKINLVKPVIIYKFK